MGTKNKVAQGFNVAKLGLGKISDLQRYTVSVIMLEISKFY